GPLGSPTLPEPRAAVGRSRTPSGAAATHARAERARRRRRRAARAERPRRRSVRRASPELREDLPFVEVEEAVLVGPDLVDRDVVVSGVGELPDRVQVVLRIRPARDELRDVALADVLRGLLEVPGKWKLLSELSGNRDDRPPLVGGLPRLGLVGGPAHLDLRDAGLSGAATAIERFDHLGVRGDADVAVADLPRELGGLLSGARDVDRRRRVGKGVDPRAVQGVVLPRAG